MTDIVERLRRTAEDFCADGPCWPGDECSEAADEIERLRKALQRITHAPYGRTYCADGHEEAVLIARAALEGK